MTHEQCENCGDGFTDGASCVGYDPENVCHRFCTSCGAYADALAIGMRLPVFLYEGGGGAVTNWGSTRLGTVIGKTMPALRSFQPVRFRVRMLDGSIWYGTGPSSNGNYIRLRPLIRKGQ